MSFFPLNMAIFTENVSFFPCLFFFPPISAGQEFFPPTCKKVGLSVRLSTDHALNLSRVAIFSENLSFSSFYFSFFRHQLANNFYFYFVFSDIQEKPRRDPSSIKYSASRLSPERTKIRHIGPSWAYLRPKSAELGLKRTRESRTRPSKGQKMEK